ncbi:MAG: hypothetical protein DRK00_06260 [Thermoprotei archaeon]|nr:MAG: hypothetical protein DRK00_06260 [Thermoprotei archaeon]
MKVGERGLTREHLRSSPTLLSQSKRRVIAALIEARGEVAKAAKLAGVSRQYVYEVIGKLRGRGFKIRAFPSLTALGRAFMVFTKADEVVPMRDLAVMKLVVYRFDSMKEMAILYVVPGDRVLGFSSSLPPQARVYEVVDVMPSAPWMKLAEVRPEGGEGFQIPPRVDLDPIDREIIVRVYEDYMRPLSTSIPGLSKSVISYHYRRHVKPILRVFLDPCPRGLYPRPLILAAVEAESEGWLKAVMKSKEVYIAMVRPDLHSAFVLLDVENPFELLKRVAEAVEKGVLGLRMNLVGYVDHLMSSKLSLPAAFKGV